MQIRLLGNILVLCLTVVLTPSAMAQTSPCANGQESGLPLPSTFLPAKLPEFQAQLKSFLSSGKYRTLNWCEDKKLRDTGPFVNGVSYGVHPTVKIYYSPSVINWLLRKTQGQANSGWRDDREGTVFRAGSQVPTPAAERNQWLDHHDQRQ